MTTIAYKDGVIAYDSRFTCGDVIEDDDADKKIERDGKVFFLSGSCSDWEYLIDSYINGKAVKEKVDARCLVVESGQIYSAAVDDNGFWKCIEKARQSDGHRKRQEFCISIHGYRNVR